MDSVGKHLGLKNREEAHILKEHEKLRLASRRIALHLQKHPDPRPTVDRGPRGPCGVSPGTARDVTCVPLEKPAGSPLAAQSRPLLPRVRAGRPSGRSPAAAEPCAAPFRPREFYKESSAMLHHQPLKRPPAIAPGAGTSRPMPLTSPPARRAKRWVAATAPSKPPLPISEPEEELPRRKSVGKAELLLLTERHPGRAANHSSLSSESDPTATLLRRRVRIHPLFRRQSSSPLVTSLETEAVPQAEQESHKATSLEEQPAQPPAGLVMPTLVEEVIASLHSEAQLASDQTFKELVQSILGPTYDFETEADDVYVRKSFEQKEPEEQPELELQQWHVSEDLYEVQSSIFQLEPEDTIEWGISDAESMIKRKETLEIVPVSESSKPVEGEQPASDSKAAKRMSLKNSRKIYSSFSS